MNRRQMLKLGLSSAATSMIAPIILECQRPSPRACLWYPSLH